jgi:hypothetical protein
MQELAEEVARRCPKPPLMEVREADDVAEGVWLVFVAGTIQSGCATFVTGRRSPSSTSRNAIFSTKLE